jgi:hypothetical protein
MRYITHTHPRTTDAPLDNHPEASPSTGWRETYRLLGVTPPDEPCRYPPETLAALEDESRTLRNRRKHARRTTT